MPNIQSLNDLDLVRVVVKIIVKNSSHGPGCYSKSGLRVAQQIGADFSQPSL